MKYQNNFKNINWTIFSILLFVGAMFLVYTIYNLYSTAHITTGEEAQSRAGLRWGFLHTIIAFIIVLLSSYLALGWKRIFPFNVPIAIIIAGLSYMLLFLTFTIGWIGMLGMMGFLVSFLIGLVLMVSYIVFFLLKCVGRKG
ncbi:hypothetical protein [Halalkalibacillus halophilus]|uniref:hypothetical protein n=1 Tax=Halalkalibacillus halophilus TaxID=392827 RepID=UPI000486E385|nr:hypothetical protein [Halalkalibacillus halophilus]